MPLPSRKEIRDYVAANISGFHQTRLLRLEGLKLKQILKRKNPYLFKAKNILTAEALVRVLLDAHLSSQEETLFGDFWKGWRYTSMRKHLAARSQMRRASIWNSIVTVFAGWFRSSPAPTGATAARSTRCATISTKPRALPERESPSSMCALSTVAAMDAMRAPTRGVFKKLCGQRF